MATTITAGNATDGLKITPDNTGILELKTGTGAGTTALTLGTSQDATFAGNLLTPNFNSQSTFSFKNRIINGSMSLWQRSTSATVTAGTSVPTISTGYPASDRFFVYSTGANVTAARIAGSGAVQYRYQITGAASVTAIGIGQRIEQANSYDLAGSTCTLSVDLANSLLTTVTWTASYANTADTFGTIGTPTKTQIATGTFTVNSTVTRYSVNISVPAAATTGIEILFTVGAQTSGTWVVGNVQFEPGAVATRFDYRPFTTELALCQRYYETGSFYIQAANSPGSVIGSTIPYKSTKRVSPTLTTSGVNSGGAFTVNPITADLTQVMNFYATGNANGQVFGNFQSNAEL